MRPNVYGIDISDRSIEIVGMRLHKGRPALLHASRIDIPAGAIDRGHIVDPGVVAKYLSVLLDRAIGTKRGKISAGIAVPSAIVYSRNFLLPSSLDDQMLKNAATIEAQDSFPVSSSDAIGDLLLGQVPQKGGNRSVMYFAIARTDIRAYMDVLARSAIEPLWIDSEDLSVARGVDAERPKVPTLVMDMGARTTTLLFSAPDGPHLSASIAIGGDDLTSAVEAKLSIPLAQAEALKRKWGVDRTAEEGKLFSAIKPQLDRFVIEMQRTIRYIEQRFGVNVRSINLCGGTSLLLGLPEYLKTYFPETTIVRGDPFKDIDLIVQMDRDMAVIYASAIGLSLRAIGARNGPTIDLSEKNERRSSSATASFSKFFNAITSRFSMVSKKPHAKKKKIVKSDDFSVDTSASSPPPMRIDSAPMQIQPEVPAIIPTQESVPDLTPPEMMVKEPVPMSVVSLTPEPVVQPVEEETDFGSGIGDILAQPEKVTPRAQTAPSTSYGNDDSRRSIESILKGEDDLDDSMEADEGTAQRPISQRGSWMTTVLLLVLVAVFVAAAAGVYMYIRKNGLPVIGKTNAPIVVQNEVETPVIPTVPETVNVSVMIVSDKEKAVDGVLLARAVETDVKKTDTFAATGEAEVGAGKASGKAMIINTTSAPYTFVATTRLMSKEGVLFRMVSTTAIPASGEIEVSVIADKPGVSGDIGPTTFIIPGLSADLQTKVTAESSSAMSGGGGKAKAISQEDIDKAKASIEEKLKTEALDNIKAMVLAGEVLSADLVTSKEVTVTAPKEGTVADTLTVSATYRFRVILIPEKDVTPLLDAALKSAIPEGTNSTDYAYGTPSYTILAFDTAAEKAEVRAEATVKIADAPLVQ